MICTLHIPTTLWEMEIVLLFNFIFLEAQFGSRLSITSNIVNTPSQVWLMFEMSK